MAKAKSSGKRQNASGGKPTRRGTGKGSSGKAVPAGTMKKKLSAKSGKTGAMKGPAAKKPARAKGAATTPRRKGQRTISKPTAKAAATGGRKPGAKSSTTARKPSAKAASRTPTPTRKRRVNQEQFAEPANRAPGDLMPTDAASPQQTSVSEPGVPVDLETVPPEQPDGPGDDTP